MFEITIKEIKSETKLVRGAYEVLRERLITQEELDKSAWGQNPYREKFLAGEVVLIPEHGYAPEHEQEVESTHEIYTQRVAELDLPAVIKAINQI